MAPPQHGVHLKYFKLSTSAQGPTRHLYCTALFRWLLRSYEQYVSPPPSPRCTLTYPLCQPQDSSAQINSRDSPTHSASGPSNEDIEAVIQMATSATNGRSPAPKDTRTQLFVGNVRTPFFCVLFPTQLHTQLPYRVRWQDLKDLFRKAGTVLRADVSLGPDNRSRGYGTVLLATAEDAGRAVDMFNGYNWQTRTLEVRPDRIAPDFDSPIPIAAPSAGYHSPSMSQQYRSYPRLD